jgi:hypothetical protein
MKYNYTHHLDTSDLQTGDGWLVRNKLQPFRNPVSLLRIPICFFTGDPHHHAAALLIDNEGERWVVESVFPKAIATRLEEYLARHPRHYTIVKLSGLVSEEEMKIRLLALPGKWYDLLSLVLFQPIYQVTRMLTGKGIWLGQRFEKATRAKYCFEALSGFHPELFKKPWNVTAVDFLPFVTDEKKSDTIMVK